MKAESENKIYANFEFKLSKNVINKNNKHNSAEPQLVELSRFDDCQQKWKIWIKKEKKNQAKKRKCKSGRQNYAKLFEYIMSVPKQWTMEKFVFHTQTYYIPFINLMWSWVIEVTMSKCCAHTAHQTAAALHDSDHIVIYSKKKKSTNNDNNNKIPTKKKSSFFHVQIICNLKLSFVQWPHNGTANDEWIFGRLNSSFIQKFLCFFRW